MSGQTRQFDRTLDRLSSAVGEKRAVQSRKRAQLLREWPLEFVVIKIGDVNQLRRLLANRLRDPRMRVPEGIHAEAGDEIQIALVGDIPEKDTLATRQYDWITVIGMQQKLPLTFDNLFESIDRKS